MVEKLEYIRVFKISISTLVVCSFRWVVHSHLESCWWQQTEKLKEDITKTYNNTSETHTFKQQKHYLFVDGTKQNKTKRGKNHKEYLPFTRFVRSFVHVCFESNESRNNKMLFLMFRQEYQRFAVANMPFRSQFVSSFSVYFSVVELIIGDDTLFTLISRLSITCTSWTWHCSAFKWHFCCAQYCTFTWKEHFIASSVSAYSFICIALNCVRSLAHAMHIITNVTQR